MEIVLDSAVRFKAPYEDAQFITSCIEKSEILNNASGLSEVLVNWQLPEMERLAGIVPREIKVPSPITRDYDWPGLFKPFNHQVETAEFLTLRKRAFCFNEAGTGKTSAAIWAADYLMKKGLIHRVLVICPLSIMFSAWQADLFKTAMHRTCAVCYGTPDKRKKIIAGNYEFVIINYDGVSVIQKEIAAGGFDLIIVDEANAYKNATTQRWKTLSRIIHVNSYLWLMTGTPASQSPLDAYGLGRLVNPSGVPKFVTAWRDKVMQQITRFKWIPKPQAKEVVFNALQPAIRFEKAQCLDLPDVVYQIREVPLTPQAKAYYRLLKKEMMVQAAGEQVSAVNAAASLNKLLQLSGGAVYTDSGEVLEFDVSPRKQALREVMEETEQKVIVFVPYRHTISVVSDFLAKEGYSSEIISGSVSARERNEIFIRFQTATNPRVLIIQPQAASHGVTLTAANTVVFWSPVMSVETYLQCIARMDRVGQQNKMTVVHLQGSDVERRVFEMLQNKVDMHNKLVDLYQTEIGIGEDDD